MIDKNKIIPAIDGYKQYFHEHWNDEKYKWEAVKWFQDNWDINAPDFGKMFKKATEKTYNLLASGYAYPRRMIIAFAEVDEQAVRDMFTNLFDEDIDITDRAEAFMNSSEEIRKKYDTGLWKNHYQNLNAVSTYLWLMYPDKYYIYKYELYRAVAQELDNAYVPKKNSSVQNIIDGFRMYDEICGSLSADSEIKQMLSDALTSTCYSDEKLKTATIDFGFYIGRFYKKGSSGNNRITRCWMVGAYDDSNDTHQDEEFVRDGIWKNGYTDKFLDDVNSVQIGDKIAIKTTYTKKKDLPFDNNGETISVMNVKIVGTVTGNHMDGRTLDVDWDTDFVPKEWYFYTFRNTITLPKESDWRTQALIDFMFYNAPQEYDKFRSEIKNSEQSKYPEGLTVANAEFVKYMIPLQKALKELGGSATRQEAHDKVVELLDISDEELSVTYEKTGASRVLNQIDFARNYLAYEGFINKSTKGVWALTELGMNAELTPEAVGLICSKWVKITTAKRKGEPLPEIDLSAYYKKKSNDTKYNKQSFLKDVFMSEEEYDKLMMLLKRKKNIILQGAPGVGKTYAAKRLAYSVIGEKNDNRVCMVQFHQNYSYEDFIMGYRPSNDGSFELRSGVFYNFCERCKENPDKPYFFIIDEINRGNLSKIFGELLMLIEADKRGSDHKINLVYGSSSFYIPENLYIIGMMNTADRSLAMIDYALRRRFSFFTMKPAFEKADSNGFSEYTKKINCQLYHKVVSGINEINSVIHKDTSLGKGFEIGHSYFAPEYPSAIDDKWVRSVIDYEIIPLIEEYWFDDEKKVDKWTKYLYEVIGASNDE